MSAKWSAAELPVGAGAADQTAPRHRFGNMNTVDRVVEGLLTPTHAVGDLVAQLPSHGGFYAWWLSDRAALPSVPVSENGLLYVGITPSTSLSKGVIRTRVLRQHLGSSLSRSTLRRALAAVLWQSMGWTPTQKASRLTLADDHEAALTAWQTQHLRVSWHVMPTPYDCEPAVIAAMAPPLNSKHNEQHPYYPTLRALRARLLATSRQT
jgi:hypothetical protein